MQIMKKKSRSYNQAKLKILSDTLCDSIESLLEYFGLEYRQQSKMITMSCPIHGGDNPSALNLYPEGESYRGNWKCRTHHCEEIFKSSIIGFIRGVLSHQTLKWEKNGDQACSFDDAVSFAEKFSNKNLRDIKISRKTLEKNQFINTVKHISSSDTIQTAKIGRCHIQKSLQIPSRYFLSRGFSKEILMKYDVGECNNSSKEMFGRAVVPIYDIDHKFMVGCSGRSIFEKCNSCSLYHNPNCKCPESDDAWKNSKWRHSYQFKTQEHLYNLWFAKEHIINSRTIILVESPGNVWRLEESGIHNSVAIFGSSLADKQKMLIDMSGAMSIILLMDNDDAGRKACEQIIKKCHKIYNIHTISINHPDVGCMTVDQIQQEIIPQINKLS